jgi:hypothetical protein
MGQRTSSSLPFAYILPRLVRHFMPHALAQAFLHRGWIISAGAETADPASVSNFYLEQLRNLQFEITGKRILLFGYGGRFDVAVGLLEAGAAHVVVCDLLADSDHRHNAKLLPDHAKYLENENGRVVPRNAWMTVIHGDIREVVDISPFDIVFSNSVFEHLRDAPGITKALARITQSTGAHIHRIDLRDHYFRYPFEMLRFSSKIWANFFDPSSHHNRYRLRDFRRLFERNFGKVDIEILRSDPDEFELLRKHIRQEFISGDILEDAAMVILLVARDNKVYAQ